MKPPTTPPFRCELCGDTEFDDVFVRDTGPPSGLRVCRGCRLVYLPRPTAPGVVASVPVPPDLTRYGPAAPR